jgi:hypothetical protein
MAPMSYFLGTEVMLDSKRDFQHMIKNLRWGDFPGLPEWAQSNHKGPQNKEHLLIVEQGRNDYRKMVRQMQYCWL